MFLLPLRRFASSLNRFSVPIHRASSFRSFNSSPILFKKVQFNLADIGEGITECELIQWFVESGAKIQQFDKICEVQSDKATVEITSRYDGKITKLHYKQGDIAKVGQPLVDIETDSSLEPESNIPEKPETVVKTEAKQNIVQPSSNTERHISLAVPSVRRLAKENGIELSSIKGTGKDGRVTKEDILSFMKTPNSVAPAPATASSLVIPSGSTKTVPLTAIQKAMVKSMKSSLNIPHFGFADEIVFNNVKSTRIQINKYLQEHHKKDPIKYPIEKISYMPILLKSFSLALEKYPLLNAQFVESGPHILYRSDHNIGIAIDSPSGLLVPSIKCVNKKSIIEIAQDLKTYQKQASLNQLPPSAYAQTSVTMSNIGNLGGKNLHPVIPPDQVCIVALGKSYVVAQWNVDSNHPDGGKFVPREVMTASFSADHRVVDGATVARFFLEWKSLLEDPVNMLLNLK